MPKKKEGQDFVLPRSITTNDSGLCKASFGKNDEVLIRRTGQTVKFRAILPHLGSLDVTIGFDAIGQVNRFSFDSLPDIVRLGEIVEVARA